MPYPPAGSERLRRGRHSEQGRTYLVTFATKGREPIFAAWEPAYAAARTFAALPAPGFRLLCWVLMPDHWHGLLELSGGNLSTAVRCLKGRSARAANGVLLRTGRSVWADGFHDRALRAEDDLLDTARYIIRNPVRAGIVTRCGAYSFWNAAWLDRGVKHRG